MNLLNLPDWNIEHVEDSARDYRVHATYGPEPSSCIHCGKGTLFDGHPRASDCASCRFDNE